MNLAQVISFYISANILLMIAFFIVLATTHILKNRINNQDVLKLHYGMLTILMGIAAALPLLPKQEIFKPVAKIWVAPERKWILQKDKAISENGYLEISSSSEKFIKIDPVKSFGFLVLLIILFAGIKLSFDLRFLLNICDESIRIRKIHSVSIYSSEKIKIPFSFWWLGKKNILLPEAFISTASFRMALLHELQHHRQDDTKWVYILWCLRVIFCINPVVYLWNKWISQIQEFACDEALINHGKVESLAYANCLVQAAKHAFDRDAKPICAMGMAFLIDRNILKRRIMVMLEKKTSRLRPRVQGIILSGALLVLGFSAYASQNFVQDRRITMKQAQELVQTANKNNEFPVVMNEKVLKWLNYYLGTPDGRIKVKIALTRMENYKSILEKKFNEYQIPKEFLAIPLIEAGYQNLPAERNPLGAAGLWQFLASTAKNFGLQVDTQNDERLNVELSTDAAVRYLLSNKYRFKDWQLSILSYNAGENAVQKAMVKTGSRDPWVLVTQGFSSEENSNYLPKLMAGILIIKNANLVE